MTKFNLFLALSAISTTVFAGNLNLNVKTSHLSDNAKLSQIANNKSLDLHKIKFLTEEEQANLPRRNKAKVQRKESETFTESEWTLLSGARVKDPLLTTIGYFMPEIHEVDLYQNNDDETIFAVKNPLKDSSYNGFEFSFGSSSSSSSSKYYIGEDNVMEIFTEDEDLVYANPVVVGTVNSSYTSYFGGSKLEFVNLAGYYIQNEGKDKNKSHYGYMENNVITFPAGTMYLFVDDKAVAVYTDDYSIALPEGKLYETSIVTLALNEDQTDYDYATCTSNEDDFLAAMYYIGGDVENVVIAVVPMYCFPSDSYYEYAIEYAVGSDTENGYVFITPYEIAKSILEYFGSEEITHLSYSLVAVAVDDEGNYIPNSGSVVQCFHQPDESEYYKSIGKGVFTDDFFASYLGYKTPDFPSTEVEIEESLFDDDKGLIRIVNPFDNLYPKYTDTSHNHYLYMNVLKQEGYPICVQPSCTGVSLGAGDVTVMSLSYYSMFEDSADSSVYASYDEATNTITFPAQSLLMGQPFMYKGDLQYTNYQGGFSLKLPDDYNLAAVNSVIADTTDAPVEYFNLQGMKIANPTPGQLIIKRQGKNTTKFIVK